MNFAAGLILTVSGAIIFTYGNFLMLNRPNIKMFHEGFIYPMPGKGAVIYISSQDYLIIGLSVLGIIISLLLSKAALNISKS